MKKDFMMGMLASALIFSVIGSAQAFVGKQTAELDYNNICVTLDGEAVELKDANGNYVEPFAINGTTYLPVRAVSSALGLEVSWDPSASTVVLTHPESSRPIYITRTGKKYHFDPNCNGGTYWEVPFSTAVGMGLEPCDKCVHS